MKVKLIHKIVSTTELRASVATFEAMANRQAILLMNEETRKVLEDKCLRSCGYEIRDYGTLKRYDGRKIFIDDELEFGEIDIR